MVFQKLLMEILFILIKKNRLEGIDAPEIKQQCKKPFLKISFIIGFEFNKDYSVVLVWQKKN